MSEAEDRGAAPTTRVLQAVAAVFETMQHLLAADGCAWHRDQTHESLTKFVIEETYELVDAIEQGSEVEVAGELGDVLYQVLFHAALASRDDEGYDFASVVEGLNEKLIARHPHVFGDRGYMSVDELHAEWERLKEDAAGERRGSRAPLEGIPTGLPPLARAAKTVERLRRANLLDPQEERSAADDTEIGDALLDVVMRANVQGVDPDQALRQATARLVNRLGA